MIIKDIDLGAPIRQITAVATAYKAGATALPFPHNGDLVSIKIDRVGESKFFGYGVSQKATINIRDKERIYNIDKDNYFDIAIDDTRAFPLFYVKEINRNEKTNELTITAFDAIEKASAHTVNEITLTSYTIGEFAAACAAILGLSGIIATDINFSLYYEAGANFDGTETLREALNDIAEVTQTIYYINPNNELVFKRLDKDGISVFTIGKDIYFDLESKTNSTLAAICSATELGDNLTANLEIAGETYYIRDNAFLDLREDRAQLVDAALVNMGGLTINQFTCNWRGNYLVEIGDKIALITKDDQTITSYFVNDTITYNGALSQVTSYEYNSEEKAETNSTSLGEAIKQTFARVDKVNKEINLVVSETNKNSSEISAMQLNTNSISASVSSLETKVDNTIEGINEVIEDINKKVSATMTDEEIEILVEDKISNGVSSVETTTGFTFNQEGLNISKSNSNITTTITENGMVVKNSGNDMLTANNDGVKAVDLHATTFLLIGDYSRIQNMPNKKRTGCYWIGG